LFQHFCSGCGRTLGSTHRSKQCTKCQSAAKEEQPSIDPLAQIGENATQLMATLPVHSHHRAPLLHTLSQHIPSTTAATLLHAAPSTVRNAKRGDYSGSDLLQQHYPHGVKRQKLSSERRAELTDFLDVACPTKSGERHHTHHQFTTNQLLYDSYRRFTANPISFHSFLLFKRLMRVRQAGRYLGQFDCSRCITLNKLQFKNPLTAEEESDLRHCQKHQQTSFLNASIIS